MRRAQRRKYHYFYKTTCLITNRYYYGIHSTDNLDDGYIGSGKRLWYSINKYGRENHICKKLEFFETRKKLVNKEIEFVNEDLLKDPMCMNLMKGGKGGFISVEQQKNRSIAGGMAYALRLQTDKDFRNKHIINQKQKFVNMHKSGKFNYNTFEGKHHSEKTKEKMRNHKGKQQGEKNSQFGTKWITNGVKIKKIKKDQIIPNGWKFGRKKCED